MSPCHFGDEIDKALAKYSAEVLYIPGGCTSFLQPLDVSFNKPPKDLLRTFYKEWLVQVTKELENTNKSKKEELMTKSSILRAPEESVIKEWFLKALPIIKPEVI